jgi:hypothetical protein
MEGSDQSSETQIEGNRCAPGAHCRRAPLTGRDVANILRGLVDRQQRNRMGLMTLLACLDGRKIRDAQIIARQIANDLEVEVAKLNDVVTRIQSAELQRLSVTPPAT